MSNRLRNVKAFLNKDIFRQPRTAVGLDIGSKFIKIVEIKEDSSGYKLEHYGIRELPAGVIVDQDIMDRDAVADNIRAVVKESNIKEKNVALTVTSKNIIIKRVSMKKTGRGEFQKNVEEIAKANIPFDLNEVSFGVKILRENKDTRDILLVAAKNEAIYPLIDIVREAGLAPARLDATPFALQNAFKLNGYTSPQEEYGIVDIGFERTSVVFIKDGLYDSHHDIAVGIRTLIEAIQKTANTSFDNAAAVLRGEKTRDVKQEVVDDVTNSTAHKLLKRVERGSSSILKNCKKIILGGGGATTVGIRDAFAKRFEVAIGDPLKGIRHVEFDVPSHTLDVAIGLALLRLSRERMGVNLLPAEERPRETHRVVRILKATIPIFVFGGTLLLLVGLARGLAHKENRLRKDVENLRAIQLTLQPKLQRVNELMQKRKVINLKMDVLRELEKDKFLRAQLLDELNRLITPNTWLTYIKEEGFGSGLHISFTGITTSNLAVSSFLRSLNESSHFKDVKLSYTRMKKIGQVETTEFEIKGVFK